MAKTAAQRNIEYRTRLRGRPPHTPDPCGTRNAAARHRRRNEPLDTACAEAEREYHRNSYVKRNPASET